MQQKQETAWYQWQGIRDSYKKLSQAMAQSQRSHKINV